MSMFFLSLAESISLAPMCLTELQTPHLVLTFAVFPKLDALLDGFIQTSL